MKHQLRTYALAAALALTTSISSFALEVGDSAPCVVLEQQSASGQELEGCIRDVLNENQTHTLIEFFSITCSTCQKNLPKVAALATDISKTATTRLVSVDRKTEDVKAYLASQNVKPSIVFPVAFDVERDAKKAYGVVQTPTLFILNRANVVVYKHSGELSEKDLAEIRHIVQ